MSVCLNQWEKKKTAPVFESLSSQVFALTPPPSSAGRSCRPQTAGTRLKGGSLSCCRLNSCSSTAGWRWRLRPVPAAAARGAAAGAGVRLQRAESTRTLLQAPGQVSLTNIQKSHKTSPSNVTLEKTNMAADEEGLVTVCGLFLTEK